MSETSPTTLTLVHTVERPADFESRVQEAEEDIAAIIEASDTNTFEYLQATPKERALGIRIVAEAMQEPIIGKLQKPLADLKDWDTLKHSTRVSVAGVIMGYRFGVNEEGLQTLAEAGLVHDVGKADPELQDLVQSPVKFGDESPVFQRFKRLRDGHPGIAADQIMATGAWEVPHRAAIADIARGHHAFRKGDAYGQRPEFNLELARIMALADTVDGDASARGYKPVFSLSQTRSLIQQEFEAPPQFIAQAFAEPQSQQLRAAA